MAGNRDDFTEKTKDCLAKRVGYRCSNPRCRKLTCAASYRPKGYVSIGVAAHICAAAPGGMRYDPNMSHQERKSILNGIWLCQSCSKLIDCDELRYPVGLLHKWKQDAETEAIRQLENNVAVGIDLDWEYENVKSRPSYESTIRFMSVLNQEVYNLLFEMKEIQKKLDAARMEADGFWVRAYTARLESMMELYTTMNEKLSRLAQEARSAEDYVRGINSYAYAIDAHDSIRGELSIATGSPDRVYIDERADQAIVRIISCFYEIRCEIKSFSNCTNDLHMERIWLERAIWEEHQHLSSTMIEK